MQRKSDPKRLSQLFRGELDWIVMKCLEKDRNRRYETANGFAMDVQRYLADEPVLACPPSAWYRLRKLVRRNKGKVAAAAAMIALVLTGTAASTWQAVRASRAEQRTSAALKQTREALDALTEDVVQTMFARQPQLGEKESSDDFPGVLEYRRDLASGIYNLGLFLTRQGKNAAAEEPLRQALEMRKALVKQAGTVPDHRRQLAETYHTLAHVLGVTGRPKAAESDWRSALELWQQLAIELPPDPDTQYWLAATLSNLAILHNQRREFEAAVPLLERARAHVRAALGKRPKDRSFRELYRDYLIDLAQTQLGLADHARVGVVAAEIVRFGYEPAIDTYNAACSLERCVTLAEKDAALSEAKRKELAQSYSQQAMALLHQAVARGFKDVALMKKDTDLDALRPKEEFRKLLADLEARSGKK
jgi:tetratricopeptide (TPR) repeat protein